MGGGGDTEHFRSGSIPSPRRRSSSPARTRSRPGDAGLLLGGDLLGLILLGVWIGLRVFRAEPGVADQEAAVLIVEAAPAKPSVASASATTSALLESERNTMDVFRRADPSVVFVTNKARDATLLDERDRGTRARAPASSGTSTATSSRTSTFSRGDRPSPSRCPPE